MKIDLKALPNFVVHNITRRDKRVDMIGTFQNISPTCQWKRCYLYVGEDGLVHCKILLLGHNDELSTLQIVAEEDKYFVKDKEYGYLDPYEGDKASLVLNRYWKWELTKFIPRDSRRNGIVVPGGWDHEHCEVCTATISETEQTHGFRNQDDKWVCQTCYTDIILVKRLEFPF